MSHVTYLSWLEGGFQIDRHGLAAIPALRPFATQQSAGHWSTRAGHNPESKGRPWPPAESGGNATDDWADDGAGGSAK